MSDDTQAMRDEILAIVAHDLRTPLNTVKLSVGLAHRHVDSGDKDAAHKRLDVIVRAADRACAIINDLLDVTRIQSGKFTLTKTQVSPLHLVHDVVADMMMVTSIRNVQLYASDMLELPELMADGARITQVFTNLIDNALKYSSDGSDICVAANRENDDIVFSVSDTGHGITPENVPHLFDRFWQVSNDPTARKSGGLGLGLAICKGIIEEHGGKIWADSIPGVGTTISFSIPIAAQTQGPAGPAEGATP